MTSVAGTFHKVFKGLERAHGTYTIGEPDARGKVQGKARTLKEAVTDRTWDEHLSGETGLGIVPVDDDGLCCFGAIDIDVYDLNLEHLEKKITKTELPLVVTRTKSGGAHLYLFIDGTTKASLVRDKLMEWSVVIGYPNVEVFPKQSRLASEDDIGSWINMPYFNGDRTTRYAIHKGKSLKMKGFLALVEKLKVTGAKLIKIEGEQNPLLDGAPPCLQHLAAAGFPQGTRNMALYNLGVFCKLKYGDDWKVQAREINKGLIFPSLSDSEVTTTLKQLEKKNYFYRCKEPPIVGSCNKAICSKREYGIKHSADDPGITLDGLVKVLTEPPMWFINVDGKRVQINSSEILLSQRLFEKVCVDAYNIVPNRIKENAWRDVLRDLMDKVEEVDAPEDAGPRGQFIYLLEKFCIERGTATRPSEIMLEKVFAKKGRMYFKSAHLLAFLDRHKFRTNAKQAWSFLREIGGETHRFRVGGRLMRTWSIPAIKPMQIKFDIPKITDSDDDIF